MLEIPPELSAAIKRALAPAKQIDEAALEERILVKARLATMRMLVNANVVSQSLLDQLEQRYAAILKPDASNLAAAAFGALSRPAQPQPQPEQPSEVTRQGPTDPPV